MSDLRNEDLPVVRHIDGAPAGWTAIEMKAPGAGPGSAPAAWRAWRMEKQAGTPGAVLQVNRQGQVFGTVNNIPAVELRGVIDFLDACQRMN